MAATAEWTCTSTASNEAASPDELERLSPSWQPATVPGVVEANDPDDRDWWYRGTFPRSEDRTLRLDGLATVADIFVNGELVLRSDNMFVRHRVPISAEAPVVHICFRSLTAALAERRPRPRWKTRLVEHQQLRWFRTSVLRRMVGPWRAITLDDTPEIAVRARLEGNTGVVDFQCTSLLDATLTVGDLTATLGTTSVGAVASAAPRSARGGRSGRLHTRVKIEKPSLWWPHTHGEPALYDFSVRMGDQVLHKGRVGFRAIEAKRDFVLQVNGVPIFCRGACWSRGDLASLDLLRDAGGNMVRVGGTMVYEDDDFYEHCDELGLLVWQDFMFANMDYPADDSEFVASVRIEASQQVERLQRHPSVAVWCGNSEVEQQAAMVGVPRELWRNRLFDEVLPSFCEGEVYVPSTPSGGALPFHTSVGLTHYYGVGAYRRPIDDVRRADVRFAPECLGFSNVGADANEGVPRDPGTDWDFTDVREHYVRELFGVEPRSNEALSRVTTGEVMSQVFSEWRSTHSHCNGALVWFLQDLSRGSGWGILDVDGKPKACWYALRRVWQPRTVVLTDEGLNGLHAHVINEANEPLAATLDLALLREGQVVIARGSASFELAPRSKQTFESDALLDGFYDVAYAYRFGPPGHDVVAATIRKDDDVIAEAFHFPLRKVPVAAAASGVTAAARRDGDNWRVEIQSERFLYAVRIDGADDNYFHLAPGRTKIVTVRGARPEYANAINLDQPAPIEVMS